MTRNRYGYPAELHLARRIRRLRSRQKTTAARLERALRAVEERLARTSA